MSMIKEQLIKMIQRVLETDIDLSFLIQLKRTELETLLLSL
jgi:hypothetical protein